MPLLPLMSKRMACLQAIGLARALAIFILRVLSRFVPLLIVLMAVAVAVVLVQTVVEV